MLGGAPKVGKSWMVLLFALQVAKGEPLWNLPTKQGTVLYLALEDSQSRLQDRLNRLTDDAPASLYFTTAAGTIGDELCMQISKFKLEHPDTVLVIIDTFQIVRNNGVESSYANDYEEVRQLKALADELKISLLLLILQLCCGKQRAWLSANASQAGVTRTPTVHRDARWTKMYFNEDYYLRKRSISIPLRVTEAERTAIDKKAEKAGMNRTDFLVACAMGKRITVIDDLTPLLAELRRIGNNLNQLTRLAHLGKIEAISLAETNEVLQQTYEELRQLARKGAKDWQR